MATRRSPTPTSWSSGGQTETLPVDTVVAALGFTADLGPLAVVGPRPRQAQHIKVDSTMATNLPRVYAAGDITEYPGKVRLIATGFGEAATAVNNAAVAIDPAHRPESSESANRSIGLPVTARSTVTCSGGASLRQARRRSRSLDPRASRTVISSCSASGRPSKSTDE